jgi:cytochrome c oxidase assembly protein subunit 15
MSAVFNKAARAAQPGAIGRGEVRIAGWLLFLTLLVFVLILWGGVVRLSGSGLSIPDWPLINGSLLPPMSETDWQAVFSDYQAKTELGSVSLSLGEFKKIFWIEYLHRFLAALVGIVFLAIFVRGFRNHSLRKSVGTHLVFAAMLLAGQALLGGLVVRQDLKGELVAAHLGAAFWFFGVVLWTALKLSRTEGAIAMRDRKGIKLLAWGAMLAVFIQIVSGGLVAGTQAGLVFNTFPKMGDFWIPPGRALWSEVYRPVWNNLFQNQILIQFFHRWWAFIAAALVIWVHIRALKTASTPRARLAARGTAVFIILQIILGIGNLMMKAPFGMSLAHLATGLTLFGLSVILTYEIRFRYETAPV